MKKKKIIVSIIVIGFILSATTLITGQKIKHNHVKNTYFPLMEGWPVVIENDIVLGPPTLGDLDNDGTLEIILGSSGTFVPDSGKIYVFKYDGTQMDNFPIDLGEFVGGIPSLGDIDQDSYLEIIDDVDYQKTYVLNKNGDILNGWPIKEGDNIFISRPSTADIDNDGSLDIAIQGYCNFPDTGYIFTYNKTGDHLPGNWPVIVNYTGFEGMQAIGDIDDDGDLEIVFGGSVNGGIYAFDHQGNIIDGWPVEVGKRFPSPITLADLDRNGDLEIIGSADFGHFNLYVYSHNGSKILQINDGNGLYTEIVPVDLDGDNDLELLAVKDDRINAYHHTGQTVNGWPVFFNGTPGGGGGSANGEPSVVVGDIDSDGESEILMSTETLSKNLIYAWNGDGTLVDSYPIEIVGGPFNRYCNGALALGDLDGDQDVEIVFVGYQQSISQGVYRTDIYVIDLDEKYNPRTMQWPQFHHDARHTGCYTFYQNSPPSAPIIDGPTNGKAGIEYNYTFVSIDPNGDDIANYTIDWDDDSGFEVVEGPFALGEEVTVIHTWSEKGTYTIRAKAKDVYGAESDWGYLEVTMPKNQPSSQQSQSSSSGQSSSQPSSQQSTTTSGSQLLQQMVKTTNR